MNDSLLSASRLSWCAALALIATSLMAPSVQGAAPVANEVSLSIREWPVPWERTRPRDPYMSPDGTVWFVGQQGHYLGRLNPATGEMKRYELPPGTGPHNVIVDAQGFPWYAGNLAAHIGRLDPATGEITKYPMPEGVNDPHTLAWTSTGDIWFSAQRSGAAGFVGKLHPATGKVDVIPVPGSGMRPYGLVVDANDRPWVVFMGANAIGTVDPATMQLEIIRTPEPASRIRRLTLTSDQRVWWVDAARGFMGVYNPKDRSMKQWQSPGGQNTALYAMATDPQDRVWYVEGGSSNPNRIIGFDTKTERFVSANDIPSGGGSVRHMVYDAKSKAIWFGTDTHTIGRAIVP